MNLAHLHLLITHLPILGTLFGVCLLIHGLIQKNGAIQRTSLWTFFLSGLATVPTYLTGSPANAVLLRSMPGMPLEPGDQHAEIAVIALVAASVLALIALAGLFRYRRAVSLPARFCTVALMVGLGTTGLMIWTGSLGGSIRHPEIHSAAALPDQH
jgi:uncharacterized membrane protein